MQTITTDSTILSIVQHYPQTIPVFLSYGIHCIGCKHSDYETIQEAARCNGIFDVQQLIKELENAIKQPIDTDNHPTTRILCCKDLNETESSAA